MRAILQRNAIASEIVNVQCDIYYASYMLLYAIYCIRTAPMTLIQFWYVSFALLGIVS